MNPLHETKAWKMSGFLALLLILIAVAAEIYMFYLFAVSAEADTPRFGLFWTMIPLGILGLTSFNGFSTVQPNEAKVLIFFGSYVGTVRDAGFWWVNPLTIRKHISLRIHNFNSDKLKVNDLSGNPIEIAAVVVWRVVDTAKAVFDVENYQEFVNIQSETAIRTLATRYRYDAHDAEVSSLRSNPDEVSEELRKEVHTRLEIAGVEASQARITHLAYAPEIAQAMLRRQQAEAVVAARFKIVEGAVGMVQHALTMLSEQNVIEFDEEKKAAMINNLMVALVSETSATPVINTGTLYT